MDKENEKIDTAYMDGLMSLDETDAEEFFADSLSFKLEAFEGPLDLLLELIKKAKVSIEDVKISEITEQYLDYMKELELIDLEKASDFIAMAAWLIEIKSKSLLPKPEEIEDLEYEGEKFLKQKLEEYRLYKEASIKMKEKETVDIIYRMPDAEFVTETRFVLKDMNKDGLMQALKKMFLKIESRAHSSEQRQIRLDRFTVEERIEYIKSAIEDKKTVRFSELFDDDNSKSEVITTFQALLELLKLQFVSAEQREIFGEIYISATDLSN